MGSARFKLVGLVAIASATGLVAPALAGNAATNVSDPPQNSAPSNAFYSDCSPMPLTDPSACDAQALANYDPARALEGVGPMTLPTDFDSLTTVQQFWVVANIERVDRGLSPIEALSGSLNQLAEQGAQNGADPQFPNPFTGDGGGSNWAGGYGESALLNTFAWVYDDGLGSPNGDCTQNDMSGCWGHRHNVLGDWDTPILMGAAAETTDTQSDSGSTAEEFIGGDTQDTPASLKWSAVTPYFPVGVSAQSVHLSNAGSKQLTVWASGEAMNVSIAVSGGDGAWGVNMSSCDLAAGATCQPTVSYTPVGGVARNATLNLTGPNGVVHLPLDAGVTPTVTLTASPKKQARSNKDVTFKVTVSGPNGAPTPAGSVAFSVGSKALCPSVQLSQTAGAWCKAPAKKLGKPGNHTVKVKYGGDESYLPASAKLTYRVTS